MIGVTFVNVVLIRNDPLASLVVNPLLPMFSGANTALMISRSMRLALNDLTRTVPEVAIHWWTVLVGVPGPLVSYQSENLTVA